MGVMQFHCALRHPKSGTLFFLVDHVSSSEVAATLVNKLDPKAQLLDPDNAELRSILCEYEDVFQAGLPPGLLPSRDVDYSIKYVPDAKPPYRPLYQLSPSEPVAAQYNADKHLQSGKIRPRLSPYRASHFL